VLYRAHYHAIELQLELSRRGIPYLITSGVRFFEQAHVKDVTSFVRFVANPRDEVAFKRMVKLLPGIGNKSADNHWRAWESDVNEFLSQLALISNIDAEPALDQSTDTEAVNLSSVHQAKGLEYHTVFVIWLTDGMFPSTRSLETRDAIEEERRLFYVAITRAR